MYSIKYLNLTYFGTNNNVTYNPSGDYEERINETSNLVEFPTIPKSRKKKNKTVEHSEIKITKQKCLNIKRLIFYIIQPSVGQVNFDP